jgi:hypothetical protein
VEHLADHRAIPVLGGLDGALTYLYRRWVTLYGAALDAEPDGARFGPATLERVRRRVSGEHPGLVRILAQYSSHPALGAARDHHRHLLREATGGSSERG